MPASCAKDGAHTENDLRDCSGSEGGSPGLNSLEPPVVYKF
jgi:hypothetical protein